MNNPKNNQQRATRNSNKIKKMGKEPEKSEREDSDLKRGWFVQCLLEIKDPFGGEE